MAAIPVAVSAIITTMTVALRERIDIWGLHDFVTVASILGAAVLIGYEEENIRLI